MCIYKCIRTKLCAFLLLKQRCCLRISISSRNFPSTVSFIFLHVLHVLVTWSKHWSLIYHCILTSFHDRCWSRKEKAFGKTLKSWHCIPVHHTVFHFFIRLKNRKKNAVKIKPMRDKLFLFSVASLYSVAVSIYDLHCFTFTHAVVNFQLPIVGGVTSG